MNLKKYGISVVISTLILAATILTITISALFFSSTILEQQLDRSEFEQALNTLVTLVDTVEHVSVNPGASGYMRMNLRTCRPILENDAGEIKVLVEGKKVLNGRTGSMKVAGGRLVGVGSTKVLIGSDALMVNSTTDPLGYVYFTQQEGAWASLDYIRVRATYMGTFTYYEGGRAFNRSIVRISFINITFGEIRNISGEVLNLVVRNTGMTVETHLFDSGTVTVTVSLGERSESESFGTKDPSVKGTVVYVVRMDIEIASL